MARYRVIIVVVLFLLFLLLSRPLRATEDKISRATLP